MVCFPVTIRGGGVASPSSPEANNGNSGGSGGGGGVHRTTSGGKCGSAGNTPPVSPPQGNSGGKGSYDGPTHTAGGGGGGFRELKSPLTPYTASPLDGYSTPGNRITVSAQGYPITVGAGGAGTSKPDSSKGTPGNNGSNSVFSTITPSGGG